jgi:hypothetical protein
MTPQTDAQSFIPFRQSLAARAVLGTLAVVGVVLITSLALFLHTEEAALQEQLEIRASAMAEFLTREAQFPMLVGDDAEQRTIAERALGTEDIFYVELRDASGRSSSARLDPHTPIPAPLTQDQRALTSNNGNERPGLPPEKSTSSWCVWYSGPNRESCSLLTRLPPVRWGWCDSASLPIHYSGSTWRPLKKLSPFPSLRYS